SSPCGRTIRSPVASKLLVFVANVARTIHRGRRAESDPWDGRTLEWSTTSPPPPWNFDRLPSPPVPRGQRRHARGCCSRMVPPEDQPNVVQGDVCESRELDAADH